MQKLSVGDVVNRPYWPNLVAKPLADDSLLGRRVMASIPVGERCPACGKRHRVARQVYYYEAVDAVMGSSQIEVTPGNIDAFCKELGMERG